MSDLKKKLLIVEDEESIRFLLRQNMEFEGYEVVEASDGEEGLKLAQAEGPDLILLDLMLPKMSGMEVCKRLRAAGNAVPIIMLTARGEQMDKVIGLKTGADDYITKPFDVLELAARIEAIIRRSASASKSKKSLPFQFGDVEVDFKAQVIRKGDQTHEMNRTESDLLKYFLDNEGKVLPREQIIADVWGHDFLLSSRTIDTHVTYLRKKIEDNPSDPQHIVTIHRVGYKFVR
jgi:DNA-binding response OmpR family regulator